MWSRASSDRLLQRREPGGGDGLPRARAGALADTALATLAFAGLAGCSSTPVETTSPPSRPSASPAAAGGMPAAGTHPDVPVAARADFDRAVNYMRAGNNAQAEGAFKQVALAYPQFAAPLVNLAILQRNEGRLEEAENTLKSAVARENGSAVAWTELGATQRMRGEFKEAASSYEQAIAANPRYAPAWRNLGVVSDLYLNDPNRALKAFEQYKELTGEDKPVSGWIAELRQRLGLPAKPPAAGKPPAGAPGGSSVPAAPSQAPAQAPQRPPAGTTPAAPQPAAPAGPSPANAAAASASSGPGG